MFSFTQMCTKQQIHMSIRTIVDIGQSKARDTHFKVFHSKSYYKQCHFPEAIALTHNLISWCCSVFFSIFTTAAIAISDLRH